MKIIKVQFNMATSCGSVLPTLSSFLVNLCHYTSFDMELGLIWHAFEEGLKKTEFLTLF